MTWIIQPREVAGEDGNSTGRWRLTATSDEDGGGPFGDKSHDHVNPAEAMACERCDEYCSKITGFPTRKKKAEMDEARDRKEYKRLKQKYES